MNAGASRSSRASGPARPASGVATADADAAILLPGLWMPAWVMLPLARRVERAGLRTIRFGYASHRATLAASADRLAEFMAGIPARRIHLVGHSLGGLVALEAVKRSGAQRVGRVVLLGSPYADCHSANELARTAFGRAMLGKAMAEWLAAPNRPAPGGVEIGVVAGTLRFGLGMLIDPRIPKPNDGVVSVEETKVPAMHSSTIVRATHASMLVSPEVASAVCRFLTQGTFDRPEGRA